MVSAGLGHAGLGLAGIDTMLDLDGLHWIRLGSLGWNPLGQVEPGGPRLGWDRLEFAGPGSARLSWTWLD